MNQIYFDIALQAAASKDDNRNFRIGAVAIRSDGVVVKSSNGPTPEPCRHSHAEAKLCRKIDYGAIVYVIRLRRDGTIGMSKPCPDCEKILRTRKVKKVYYTTNNGGVECMVL